MGSARNIILRLKSLRLIKLWCRDRLAFYIIESTESSAVRKPMTLSRIGGNGLKKIEISLVDLLESLPWEELCRIHGVHLTFIAENLYKIFLNEGYVPRQGSKDIDLGKFIWSKYRAVTVILHHNSKVSFILKCTNCPIESSPDSFICLASFLEKSWQEILSKGKLYNPTVNGAALPKVEDWLIVQWHYGKDSVQEFSGEKFNITFKIWCGLLARIYVHEQDRIQKLRIEVVQKPGKSLRQVTAEILNLCCCRCKCKWCSKPSL